MDPIPYIVYEGTMARFERIIRRLWILCIILVVMLVGSNLAWIIYENQFEDSVVTQTAEADDGSSAIINGSGTVNYGSEGDSNN